MGLLPAGMLPQTWSMTQQMRTASAQRLRAVADRLDHLMFYSEIDEKLTRALAQELRDEADRLEKR